MRMMPHRRQVSRRPRTGTRWRGDCGREGSLVLSPPASSARKNSQRGSGTAGGNSGSTAAGRPRQQGPEAARVGAQGLATTLDSPQRVGPLHLRPESLQDPSQAPACCDRDVTSDFCFRFPAKKRSASLQPRGLPGIFPPLCCAIFTIPVTTEIASFQPWFWVYRLALASRSGHASSSTIAPPTGPSLRHPGCVRLGSLRPDVTFVRPDGLVCSRRVSGVSYSIHVIFCMFSCIVRKGTGGVQEILDAGVSADRPGLRR